MAEPDFTHDRDRQHSETLNHQQPDEDIHLPASSATDSNPAPLWGDGSADSVFPNDGASRPVRAAVLGIGVTFLAALIGAGIWFQNNDIVSAEQQHPNWQHVEAATEASAVGAERLVRISDEGDLQLASVIEFDRQSADRANSRKIRSSLSKGDLFSATATLQSLQSLPDGDPDVLPPQIEANPELESALRDRDSELFELQLFDCCDEDGDVVEILVNGVPFTTVPIIHKGVTVKVPLRSGSNTVSVVGIRDGGGGITVSFKTSRGNYFCQKMAIGETHQMAVVVK